MSQYQIEHDDLSVIVGWDPPLATYFATVWGPEADNNLDDIEDPIIWTGNYPGEFQDLESFKTDLDAQMSNSGLGEIEIPDDIQNNLRLDVFAHAELREGSSEFIEAIAEEVDSSPENIRIEMGSRGRVVYGELASGEKRDEIDAQKLGLLVNAIDQDAVPGAEQDGKPNILITADDEVVLREERNGVVSINAINLEIEIGPAAGLATDPVDAAGGFKEQPLVEEFLSRVNELQSEQTEEASQAGTIEVLARETSRLPQEQGGVKAWLGKAVDVFKEQYDNAKNIAAEVSSTTQEWGRQGRENFTEFVQSPQVQKGVEGAQAIGSALLDRAAQDTGKVQAYLKSDDFKQLQSKGLETVSAGLTTTSKGLETAANWLTSRSNDIKAAIADSEKNVSADITSISETISTEIEVISETLQVKEGALDSSVNQTAAEFQVLADSVYLAGSHGVYSPENDSFTFNTGGTYNIELSPRGGRREEGAIEITRDEGTMLNAEKINSDWSITFSDGITNEDAKAFSIASNTLQEYSNELKNALWGEENMEYVESLEYYGGDGVSLDEASNSELEM